MFSDPEWNARLSGPETCDIGLEARLLKRVFVGSQFYDRAGEPHGQTRLSAGWFRLLSSRGGSGSLEAAFKFILESKAEPVAQKGEDRGLFGAQRCEVIAKLLVYLVLDSEKQ